jgi:hypothetical protein
MGLTRTLAAQPSMDRLASRWRMDERWKLAEPADAQTIKLA